MSDERRICPYCNTEVAAKLGSYTRYKCGTDTIDDPPERYSACFIIAALRKRVDRLKPLSLSDTVMFAHTEEPDGTEYLTLYDRGDGPLPRGEIDPGAVGKSIDEAGEHILSIELDDIRRLAITEHLTPPDHETTRLY